MPLSQAGEPPAGVIVERSDAGFLRLRLSRPGRRNALDQRMAGELLACLAADETAPVVLRSDDPRAFCAGADLTISDTERAAVSDLIYDCCAAMIGRPGPVIAVLTGPAVGGGAQLAAAADLRIAGRAAKLRFIGPPGGELAVGAWLLPELVGRGPAMDLMLTGRWVEAAEALRIGLVSRIDDDPEQAAESLAGALAQQSAAVPAVKSVALAGGLLDRLDAERTANRQAWARVLARPASGELRQGT